MIRFLGVHQKNEFNSGINRSDESAKTRLDRAKAAVTAREFFPVWFSGCRIHVNFMIAYIADPSLSYIKLEGNGRMCS